MAGPVKRRNSSSLAADGDGLPTPQQVNEVMRITQPRTLRIEHYRRRVVDAVRSIREFDPDAVRPGAERKRLLNAATSLKKARNALKELPGWRRGQLSGFLSELDLVERELRQRADDLDVRRSGGGKVNAAKMQIAAQLAFDLLFDRSGLHGFAPTLTKGGRWMSLAGLLFELGTGKAGKDAGRACQDHMNRLRRLGEWPTVEQWRQSRREAKRQPGPPWLDDAIEADRWKG